MKTITKTFKLYDGANSTYFDVDENFLAICAHGVDELFGIHGPEFTVTVKLTQDDPNDIEVYFDKSWFINIGEKREPTDENIDKMLIKELGIKRDQKFYLNFS